MEEKCKKNREAQARSRAKKQAVSFVEPLVSQPPPDPTPPSSSPTPSLHSSPRHEPTMPSSPSYTLPSSDHGTSVLDCLLRHSSMAQCTVAYSQICSPYSRRASAHVLSRLRHSYNALKRKSHSDGVAARRTILAAISGTIRATSRILKMGRPALPEGLRRRRRLDLGDRETLVVAGIMLASSCCVMCSEHSMSRLL
ncbi:hypothetical protein GOP47_0008050 [Adiantum capillus-veneris]|uniref:BZIP domain-containing protein n=1 Tax=Adiantum capillus-veneris TaxID=13818 RepID=A0A9D4ZKA3_ADICA|nr:hypothetical protein GOP47_0008050 [Adiantum capillus-veneris]